MKITLIAIGKTDKDFIQKGSEEYYKRIQKYVSFEFVVLPDLKNTKNLSQQEQKEKEGQLILSKLPQGELLLLDEGGKEMSSLRFSEFINKKLISSTKNLIFLIGGPYGFSQQIYQKASGKISLSKMTFSHQMIRMIFAEQLYRAFSILNNEPYHHQ